MTVAAAETTAKRAQRPKGALVERERSRPIPPVRQEVAVSPSLSMSLKTARLRDQHLDGGEMAACAVGNDMLTQVTSRRMGSIGEALVGEDGGYHVDDVVERPGVPSAHMGSCASPLYHISTWGI